MQFYETAANTDLLSICHLPGTLQCYSAVYAQQHIDPNPDVVILLNYKTL